MSCHPWEVLTADPTGHSSTALAGGRWTFGAPGERANRPGDRSRSSLTARKPAWSVILPSALAGAIQANKGATRTTHHEARLP